MKILISYSILDGNSPDEFDTDAYATALRGECRETAVAKFPDAEIELNIRVQRNTSGYSGGLSVDYFDDEDAAWDTQAALRTELEHLPNWLYDNRGQEFFA